MYLKEIAIYRNEDGNFTLAQALSEIELTADMIPLVCDELARLNIEAQEDDDFINEQDDCFHSEEVESE